MPEEQARRASIAGRGARWALAPLAALAALALAASAAAQTAAADAAATAASSWSFGVSGAGYVLPDDEDFVQPTLGADHGRLHLESRYNYEDRGSTSFFAGGELAIGGDKVKLTLTPMLGGLAGRTTGSCPRSRQPDGGPFEAYGEAEYVFDLGDSAASYFYMWSELSCGRRSGCAPDVVTQRTRVHQTERDIQRGLLVGFSLKRVDGTFYSSTPESDDHFTVVSLGVSF